MPIKNIKKTTKATNKSKKRKKSVAQKLQEQARAKKKRVIIDSILHCGTVTDACDAAQLDRGIYYDWLEKDKTFAKRIAEAKVERIHSVVGALHKHAIGYNVVIERAVVEIDGVKKVIDTKVDHIKPNAASGIFLVCNKLASEFKNIQRVEGLMAHMGMNDIDKNSEEYKNLQKLAEAYIRAKCSIV